MDSPLFPRTGHSACPHDCPSTCALDVEILGPDKIGRVRGSKDNSYTAGVICAKVAKYAERIHHPDRLLQPLRRKGNKGDNNWQEISWDAALDEIAEQFLKREAKYGSETIWPYFFAGTMGLVQRDGIHRLRHLKNYSGQFDTVCTNMAWTGYIAGTGALRGPDPREIADADVVVIWGTNAVNTQVNVMTLAMKARKSRGARIVAIDIYQTGTMDQADMSLCLKPGSDGALACAVMHVLFRDGYADRDYLNKFTDAPIEFEHHLLTKTPAWAAEITGLSISQIESFAKLMGENPRTFLRLGYGFTRQRNGVVNMHAACSIASVLGAWKYKGGGAFHNNGAIYNLDKTMIEATDAKNTDVRILDQSAIGAVLEGDSEALLGGPPVTGMLIQNTNPASIAPEQIRVKKGLLRDDLFVCVHEHFMTETAQLADIVLPATMFMEHDDIYKGGGHQYLIYGPRLVEPPENCRSNHQVYDGLAKRLGLTHSGFSMSPNEHIDWMLQKGGYGNLENFSNEKWIDCQPDFDHAHYVNGFAYDDGKFRFKPDWSTIPAPNNGPMGPWQDMPEFPDYWDVNEKADDKHPFRLATSPARSFLNSSFNQSPGSLKREQRPSVRIHSTDAEKLGIKDGDLLEMGNERGVVRLHATIFDGLQTGVVISEGIWANKYFANDAGINSLTSATIVAPYGGTAYHDNKVWIRPVID